MKITDVQAHVLAIPMAPGKQKMPWTWGNFNQVIISVHTEAGLTGYGEAFGYGVPQATASVVGEILKPMLVGADATQITTLQDRMFRHTHLFGRYGVTNFAISGVDIALWDLAGKSAGLPLYRLFGGAAAAEVPPTPAWCATRRRSTLPKRWRRRATRATTPSSCTRSTSRACRWRATPPATTSC